MGRRPLFPTGKLTPAERAWRYRERHRDLVNNRRRDRYAATRAPAEPSPPPPEVLV
jgi:hypothetical protein